MASLGKWDQHLGGGGQNGQAPSQASNQGALTGPLQASGLSNIPFLGGMLNGVAKGAETIAEGGLAGLKELGQATGVRQIQPSDVNPTFMSPADAQQATQNSLDPNKGGLLQVPHALAQQGGQIGVNAGSGLYGLLGAGALAKGATGIPSFLKSLTPNGAGPAISTSAEAATAAGASRSAPDILTEARQAVEDKFAPRGLATADPALKNAFGKMAQHITGVDLEPETLAKMQDFKTIAGDFTSNDLVKFRKSIMDRYGYNPENGNIDQKVADVFRDVLTKNAKDITPGLAKADSNYVRALNVQDSVKKIAPELLKYLGVGAIGLEGANLFNTIKGNGGQSQP